MNPDPADQRRAVDWALRDFARNDPQAVGDFLAGAGRVLSPLSQRGGGKHLTKHLTQQPAQPTLR